MNRNDWLVICLAYLVGLSATGSFAFTEDIIAWYWIALIAFVFCLAGVAGYFFIPKIDYRIRDRVWLFAGIIAGFAVIYFWLQIPQPKSNDISQILTNKNIQTVSVSGTVIEATRLTRSNKIQLWLKVDRVWDEKQKITPVTGKLYVTIAKNKNINFYPNLNLSIQGTLYRPQAPKNDRSFNFKYYLRQQGAFAGLSGKEVYLGKDRQKTWFSWWQFRQKIIRSQKAFLGSPKGELLSSMVLGSKAVDLDYDLRDRFNKIGLAHVFAASGFQVSLLLGLVLKLTQKYSPKNQLIIGSIVLFSYLGLTGIQPSIARATIMGIGVLIAMVSERKIRPLGSLLFAAIILLIINPIWIWDLGFQLSFLATLGLIVTVPYLTKQLDWLPPTIAELIAIPISSFLWTAPLLMFVFKTISSICIPVNIIAALPVTLISLGGMLSAVCALIIPSVGSAIAYLFYYPIEWFIDLVYWFANLPLGYLAVGKISLLTLFILYSIFVVVWTIQFWQKRWLLIGLFSFCLVFVPNIYRYFTLQQMTIIVGDRQPIIIIQDRGKIGSIATGNINTARYSILPFLSHEGINSIDCLIVLNSAKETESMLAYMANNITIDKVYSNAALDMANTERTTINNNLSIGFIEIKILQDNPTILYLKIGDEKILLLANSKDYLFLDNFNLPIDSIILFDAKIANSTIARLHPQTIIDTVRTISKKQKQILKQESIELLSIENDESLQWLPKQRWQTTTIEQNTLF
jgi:competence protein ComEC